MAEHTVRDMRKSSHRTEQVMHAVKEVDSTIKLPV
jgi:hypothetical protein